MSENRFFALCHPGAPGGIVMEEPAPQRQDSEAEPADLYAVVFFPRISGIGPAEVNFYGLEARLAQSPEAAIVKFMDGIAPGKTWETYHHAGHRVRKLRITDLGDAETGNTLSVEAPMLDDQSVS